VTRAWGSAGGSGVPGAARDGGQLIGGVARLIFEGWVPQDPVFVAVRGLEAGAATFPGGLVVAHSGLADCSRCDELRPDVVSRAPRQHRTRGGCQMRDQARVAAASQQNAASSRATAIVTTPAGL
jgi:hypothetical protein